MPKSRVLVIDDEAAIRDSLRMTLEYEGYEFLGAATGQEDDRLWSYWKEQLSGELPVLNLTTDRPRPRSQTHRGGSHAFILSTGLTARYRRAGSISRVSRSTSAEELRRALTNASA